jgi:hypothetical protein
MSKTKGVSLVTLENPDPTAGEIVAHVKCIQCHLRPRLGALTRCTQCLQAAAEVDRQSRVSAEKRVSAKADRQAALERLGDAMLEFAATPEGLRFLEIQQAELTAPCNDPKYLEALLARDKDRQIVANEIVLVHHCVLFGRSRLGLTLKDDRNLAKAREVAQKLQGLFESELIFSEDPADQTKLADRTLKQPPKHEFGREKRNLGNRSKRGRG